MLLRILWRNPQTSQNNLRLNSFPMTFLAALIHRPWKAFNCVIKINFHAQFPLMEFIQIIHKKPRSTTPWPKHVYVLSLCLRKLFHSVMDFYYVWAFGANENLFLPLFPFLRNENSWNEFSMQIQNILFTFCFWFIVSRLGVKEKKKRPRKISYTEIKSFKINLADFLYFKICLHFVVWRWRWKENTQKYKQFY